MTTATKSKSKPEVTRKGPVRTTTERRPVDAYRLQLIISSALAAIGHDDATSDATINVSMRDGYYSETAKAEIKQAAEAGRAIALPLVGEALALIETKQEVTQWPDDVHKRHPRRLMVHVEESLRAALSILQLEDYANYPHRYECDRNLRLAHDLFGMWMSLTYPCPDTERDLLGRYYNDVFGSRDRDFITTEDQVVDVTDGSAGTVCSGLDPNLAHLIAHLLNFAAKHNRPKFSRS